MRFPYNYSLAALLSTVSVVAIFALVFRYINPPSVYPLPIEEGFDGEISYAFGFQYESDCSEAAIKSSPAWSRTNKNPPLAANDAMMLADRFRRWLIEEGKLAADEGDGQWVIAAAELTPALDDHWYWVIRFEYSMSQTGPTNELKLVVHMNGTVIEPSIVKDGSDVDSVAPGP